MLFIYCGWFQQHLMNTNSHGFCWWVDSQNLMFIEVQFINNCINGLSFTNLHILVIVFFIKVTKIDAHKHWWDHSTFHSNTLAQDFQNTITSAILSMEYNCKNIRCLPWGWFKGRQLCLEFQQKVWYHDDD